ncbi:hypothetical protein [Thiolapillus sp.]
MNDRVVFVKGRRAASVAAVSIASAIFAVSLSSDAFSRQGRAVETSVSDAAVQPSSMDIERRKQMNAVEQYYLRNGIHLDKAQIAAIVEQKPEIVDLAMSERNAVVQNLVGTGGGHFEVNGEGAIRQSIPVVNGGSWAGAYVHTPEEDEALLGFRSESGTITTGRTKSNKAVWGITKGGDVYGELGSTYHKDAGVGFPPPPAIDNAYGVFGVANDADSTVNYGVYGSSQKDNGIGVYGKNTEPGGRAGLFDGPVEQSPAYGGIVKAAAEVYCGPLLHPVSRSFGPKGVSIDSSSGTDGKCEIDFGFDISERFFQATARTGNGDKPAFVSCDFDTSDINPDKETLYCSRVEMDAGSFSLSAGTIMVTIY